MSGRVRILISSCLLGEKVRYDGGHKRDPFLVETLGRFVEYVPVCPEVECGLPTPREAMRLEGNPARPRLVAPGTGADYTETMKRWTQGKLSELEELDLYGYICKKDSPSSGMERVKVYGVSAIPARVGAGMFTKAFMEHFPLIPVEEEDRLQDPALRERFVERMFTLCRFRDAIRRGRSRGTLVEFHTDHKLLLLAHGRPLYADMGKLAARAKELPLEELYRRYLHLLMEALRHRATPAKCADVLLHAAGYFRQFLSGDERRELLETIEKYRMHRIPLAIPVALIRHYARKHDVVYLKRQAFLNPHPVELMLRNHA
ncbi:MAG TPA: DUF523 and DUF1722 domain-containing protein [Candidatus Deferrimicrobiaceae bacterium]